MTHSPRRPDAIEAQLRSCDRQMRALAFSILRDRDAMDDALQNAYFKAYRNYGSFHGDSAFSTWLYTIVYRSCVDELRRRRPHESIDSAFEIADPAADPGDQLGERMHIDAALAKLPAAHRAVVILVDSEGLSFGEAAAVLGIPEGTVASRLSRARTALRQLLSLRSEGDTR